MIISNYYEMNKFSFRFSGHRRTRQVGAAVWAEIAIFNNSHTQGKV